MYCQNCGKQNQDEAKICFDCGNSLSNCLPSTSVQAVLQQTQINTSVVLYAGFWKRLAALLIDLLVVLLSCIPLMFLLIPLLLPLIIITGNNHQKMLELTNSIASIASYFMVLLYFSIMESSIKQGTLGKMALGIKVVDDDGNRISFWRSVGRNFAKLISGSGLLFIGYLIAAFTAKKQAVHDMMANCLVVNKKISSVQIQQDGPVRRMSTSLIVGLVLISLLIPIGGIVVAIVVPAYQDYKVRVQQKKKNEIENGKQPSVTEIQLTNKRICEVQLVYDGDSLIADCSNTKIKVRIFGIDAPELGQIPWGDKSRDALVNLVSSKKIQLLVLENDRYGRSISKVFVNDIDIGLEMVKKGYAVVYEQYNNDMVYKSAKDEAQAKHLGIWETLGTQQDPVAWRRMNPR